MNSKLRRTQFGEYTLIERIASGGMAEIFRATSKGLGGFEKTLAIKRLHREYSLDEQFVRMMVDEAQISVQLQHPNIVQVFDLGKVEDMYYISMEFVEGPDLFRLLQVLHDKAETIPLPAACHLLIEVCNGLHYAHFRKNQSDQTPLDIIHRDVSPQNILLSWDGDVKIADFGIAKASERLTHTQTGVIKGKFYYMSPEQAVGAKLDHRSDIFSAGILLFELLTATPLYEDPGDESVINLVRRAAVRSPRVERAEIPAELESIVMCALQKEPDKRFGTAQHMARAIHEFVTERYGVYTRADFSNYLRTLFKNTPGYSEEQGKTPVFTPPENSVSLEKFHHTKSQKVALDEDLFLEETAPAVTTTPATSEKRTTAGAKKETQTKKAVPAEQLPTKPDGHEPPVIVTIDEPVVTIDGPASKDESMRLAMVRRLPPLSRTVHNQRRSSTQKRALVLKVALTIVGLAILGTTIAILHVIMNWNEPVPHAKNNLQTVPISSTDRQSEGTDADPLHPTNGSSSSATPSSSKPAPASKNTTPAQAKAQLQIKIERPSNRYKAYIDGELVAPNRNGSIDVTAGRHVIALKLLPEGTQTQEQVIEAKPDTKTIVEFNE